MFIICGYYVDCIWTYGYYEYYFKISEPEEFDSSGVRAYVNECNRVGVIPVSFFKRHVHDNHFVMRNHGLGPLGAKAICKPLTVRCIKFIYFYSPKFMYILNVNKICLFPNFSQINTNIESLDLEGNHIEAEGAKYLHRMLRKNSYISELVSIKNRVKTNKGKKTMNLISSF